MIRFRNEQAFQQRDFLRVDRFIAVVRSPVSITFFKPSADDRFATTQDVHKTIQRTNFRNKPNPTRPVAVNPTGYVLQE
jgi:hypothetical protein